MIKIPQCDRDIPSIFTMKGDATFSCRLMRKVLFLSNLNSQISSLTPRGCSNRKGMPHAPPFPHLPHSPSPPRLFFRDSATVEARLACHVCFLLPNAHYHTQHGILFVCVCVNCDFFVPEVGTLFRSLVLQEIHGRDAVKCLTHQCT